MATSRFEALLAKVPASMEPFGYKEAQTVEGPDQTQFEQDFSKLAYMFVQDRAAPLMKYILGFEVVNREEDGSKAIGIFGFKIGKEYYYVPAFFINNQIKGIDLLFNKKTNMFVPLQEDWINHIINRQTIELGGHTDGAKVQRDFENPNFRFMAVPPLYPNPSGETPKVAADETPWSLQEAWLHMQDQLVDMIEKDAMFQDAYAGFICRLARQPLVVEKSGEASTLKQWIGEKGGPKAMSAFLGALTGNPKFANAALTFYPDVASLYVNTFSKSAMPDKVGAEIKVTTQITDYVDGEAKKRLVRDGFTVVDSRPESAKSDIYTVDYEKRFSNPELSGTYQVLLKSGCATKCWVFLPSIAARNGAAVVVEQSGLHYRVAEPAAIYVRDDMTGTTEDAYKQAVDLRDMEYNTQYLLIDDKGHSTGAVSLKSVLGYPDKRTRLVVRWTPDTVVRRPLYTHDFATLRNPERRKKFDKPEDDEFNSCSPLGCDRQYIELADHNGNIKNKDDDTLVLPANWKALKLYTADGKENSWETQRATEDAFQLGSLIDVGEAMNKNAFYRITTASDDGRNFYFRLDDRPSTPPMSYKRAYVDLVTRFGLSVEDTETLLKEAAQHFKCRRTIKLAQAVPSSSLVGVNMPPPREPTAATDPYTGIPSYITPYEQLQVGSLTGQPPKPNANQYGINIGGEAEMDIGAQNLAQQAGQAGQKKVFDHASIGGLSKLYDTGAVLDSYVPELMQSLDRLGRILFLYYWKNADFAERYGSGDIAEMEDLIRSVFKSFGELVLKLRKKSIDSGDASTIEAGGIS